MENPDRQPLGSLRKPLPWIVLVLGFVFYCLTLNRWVTIDSLNVVAQIARWDWTMPLRGPLFFLITLPVHLIPAPFQPLALNVFTAGLAASTLAVLCRILLLIPQDRTREQRIRERGSDSLPSTGFYWLGPLLAVLVLGLQLTFWEHATSSTGEMLNVLIFGCLIWFLLEYRIHTNAKWLYGFAFLLAAGMSNAWSTVGYLPFFGIALIWTVGHELFQWNRIIKMGGAFFVGLLFYALLPAVSVISGNTEASFWYHLKQAFVHQKDILVVYPKAQILLLTLTSLVPVTFIAIRWPSSMGDTSAIGGMLSGFMFRILHVLMLGTCIWVAFDPAYSPRNLGLGIPPFMSFYFLGAIAIGYFINYFALLFGVTPQSRVRRRSAEIHPLLAKGGLAFLLLLSISVPVGLVYKNWRDISATNSDALKHYAFHLRSSLPENGFVSLGDNRQEIFLLEGLQIQEDAAQKHLYLDSNMMDYQVYMKHIHQHFGDRFPFLTDYTSLPSPIRPMSQLHLLVKLSEESRLFFLHPSFGYVMELFYAQPHKMMLQLADYGENQLLPQGPSADLIKANVNYWKGLEPFLGRIEAMVEMKNKTGLTIGKWMALRLNDWGVRLQRANQLEEAGFAFSRAIALSPDNVAAKINLTYNQRLQAGDGTSLTLSEEIQDMMSQYRGWDDILFRAGPLDEPEFCFELGKNFVESDLTRQAAEQFQRSQELNPDNLEARLWLANIMVSSSLMEEALDVIKRLKNEKYEALSQDNLAELTRIETVALVGLGRVQEAEGKLMAMAETLPKNEAILQSKLFFFQHTQDREKALDVLDEQLALKPDRVDALLHKSVLYIELGQYAKAVESAGRILQIEPDHLAAKMNRAIAHLQLGDLVEAKKDYERLEEIIPEEQSFRVYFGLGEIAMRQNEKEKAINYFKKFLETAPETNPDIPEVQTKIQQLEN